MPKVLVVLMVLIVLGGVGSGQAPARDGVITGQVIDGGTGKPVSAAIVSITGAGITARVGPQGPLPSPRILTAADGRFVFKDLGAGSFTIAATKGGYADGAPGRRRPGGAAQPVTLTTAGMSVDTVVRVWKNGAITGTVTDEAGEPVVGLQVRAFARTASLAASQGGSDPAAFVRVGVRPFTPVTGPAATDDRGVYRFGNLTPGDYIVVAGPPPVSAKWMIFSDVGRTGRGTGELMALMGGASALTAAPLQIGEALVSVGRGAPLPPPPGARPQLYPPTFYPSGSLPGPSSTVTLASGEERSAIDIQLVPVSAARLSGTLMSAAGPAAMVSVRLMPAGAEGLPADSVAPLSVSDGAGNFLFAAVVPGRYSLRASTAGGAAGMAWIEMPVTIGGDDITGLVAVMVPPLKVGGRLQFDGNTPPPAPSAPGRSLLLSVPFVLDPADSGSVTDQLMVGVTGADQAFTVTGYRPGRYRVRVPNSPAGWMFKAAMLNGVDVSETPFELTRDVSDLVLAFTDRWSGISGVAQGTGSDGAAIFVFPSDAQKWTTGGWNPRRLRSVRANAKGQFGLSSLPPGEYYVVAVQEEPAGDWRDPATLESLARLATQVTILEGEHRTIDLRVREGRQ